MSSDHAPTRTIPVSELDRLVARLRELEQAYATLAHEAKRLDERALLLERENEALSEESLRFATETFDLRERLAGQSAPLQSTPPDPSLGRELAASRAELERLRSENASLHPLADRQHRELDGLHATAAAQHAEIDRLHREVGTRDAEISRLHQEIAARDGEIVRASAEVERLRAPSTAVPTPIARIRSRVLGVLGRRR